MVFNWLRAFVHVGQSEPPAFKATGWMDGGWTGNFYS